MMTMRSNSPLYLLVILISFCFITSCKKDSPVSTPSQGHKKELKKARNAKGDLVIRDDKTNDSDTITVDSDSDLANAGSEDITQEQISQDIPETDTRVYEIAETLPAFPNGEAALTKYLTEQVKRLPDVSRISANLRTMVSFIVEIDGGVTEAKVAKSSGNTAFDDHAVNIVLNMPKWIPATNEGHNVRMKYTVPVVFNSKN